MMVALSFSYYLTKTPMNQLLQKRFRFRGNARFVHPLYFFTSAVDARLISSTGIVTAVNTL